MFKVDIFDGKQNYSLSEQIGAFQVMEYQKDLSVTKETAFYEYYAQKMNIHKKQLLCDLSRSDVNIQAGAMQWFVGDVHTTTGVKGVGDFLGKAFKGAVTQEGAIKPEYSGTGLLVLEPTYKHIILMDVSKWYGGLVLEDSLYLASESSLRQEVVMRKSFSSAALGNEGLFNLCFIGNGVVALESPIPKDELIEVTLENDELKVDGSYAICWSKGLSFTVERSSGSLIGSAASGEGLVNVFRGTGKVLMATI